MLKKRKSPNGKIKGLGVSKDVLKKLRGHASFVVDSESTALTRAGQEKLVQLLKESRPPTQEMKALRQLPRLKVRS